MKLLMELSAQVVAVLRQLGVVVLKEDLPRKLRSREAIGLRKRTGGELEVAELVDAREIENVPLMVLELRTKDVKIQGQKHSTLRL